MKAQSMLTRLACQIDYLTEALRNAAGESGCVELVPVKRILAIPALGAAVRLTAMELTLYGLFLAHPEGIAANDLILYWKELCSFYEKVSWFDERTLQREKMASLCGESKCVFYSTVSRIKRKFVEALGPSLAEPYIIRRGEGGIYRTGARLTAAPPSAHTWDSS